MIPWLDHSSPFPPVNQALGEDSDAPGLLAMGADLSPQRLLQAYRQGIFPWFSEGQPILWWSTDPRMVLHTREFKISPSLRKTLKKCLKNPALELRFDRAFEQVMRSCAAPRRDGHGTWIVQSIIDGYCGLHAAGHAHSAELWLNGELVAGAYGVCLGRMFYGESMFTRIDDGSKIALAFLLSFLRDNGVKMIDCQQETRHLASLGARPIPRSAFLQHVEQAIAQAPLVGWQQAGKQDLQRLLDKDIAHQGIAVGT